MLPATVTGIVELVVPAGITSRPHRRRVVGPGERSAVQGLVLNKGVVAGIASARDRKIKYG